MRPAALFMLAAMAWAQSQEPSFEVATIKRLDPEPSGPGVLRADIGPRPGPGIRVGFSGGPGSEDPELIRCHSCTMLLLLREAYGLGAAQIFGPDWIVDSEHYEINARIAPGTAKEQYQAMLRSLLIERFRLAAHSEKRTLQVYELTIAKGGAKVKPASADAAAAAVTLGDGRPNVDRNGFPQWTTGTGGRIGVMGGKLGLHLRNQTMAEFAKTLSQGVAGRPVIDTTGLAGAYDIDVNWEMGPSEFFVSALQSQMGLKLESKKAPVDVVVVDKAEKTPAEN